MDATEIYKRTNTLSRACLKVSSVLPHDQTMATFARVELVRHASDLGIRSRGLMVGLPPDLYIERLSKTAESCNGCAFWLQIILEEGLLNKPDILDPLIKESDSLSQMFLHALKRGMDKMQ